MRLKMIVSPEMGENCYFVIDKDTNEAIIIDPGDQPEKLCGIIEKEQFDIKAICLTHCHFDHAGAVEELRAVTNAPVLIGMGEEIVAESPEYNLSAMWASPFTVPYDRVLRDGEECSFGKFSFELISTPGHTPGGCCYYFEKEGILFSGDTLFYMSVGRTDFPGGDTQTLENSVKEKLFVLPDDTVVYPGHGNQTNIGFEKVNNMLV